MNKKGFEDLGIGTLIMLFVAVVVVVSLITGGISTGVGAVSNTVNLANVSYTTAAAGSSVYIPYQALRSVTIVNASSGAVIPATNYTVTNYVVVNGALVTELTSKQGADYFQGKAVNVSATAEPFGYDTSAGGRVFANLILVFAALALAIFVLAPIIKNGVIDFY